MKQRTVHVFGRLTNSICALCALCGGLSTAPEAGAQSADVVAASVKSAAPLLLRDPAISRTHIAFRYAASIWIASRDGSAPRRLTAAHCDGKPYFSPDGSRIAFVADCSGGHGVFLASIRDGGLRQLTFHPGDLAASGWTADGKNVLFTSRRGAFIRDPRGQRQLFEVSAAGGPVSVVPFPQVAEATESPDGTAIAYVPNTRWQPEWKHYRGGQSTAIWVGRLADSHIVQRIPRQNSNDSNPMWVGESIYFLSDRFGPTTLVAYDTRSRQVRQVVHNDGFDIKSAGASRDAIIYDQLGTLHVLNLRSGADETLNIRVPVGDLPETHAGLKQFDPALVRSADISPTGRDAVFGTRGEVFTVSAETGQVRDITSTPGVVERDPVWAPDGESIAYLSDESGEYALHVHPLHGSEVTKLNLGIPPGYYDSLVWSPDSHKLAYTDQHLRYWYVDIGTRTSVLIDSDLYVDLLHQPEMTWSPDSRWIAYVKQLPNHFHAVFVYSVEHRRSYQVTDGMSDCLHVAFDAGGRHIYFTVATDSPLKGTAFDFSHLQNPVTRSIYRVEFDGTDVPGRIFPLPFSPRNYYALLPGKPGVLLAIAGPDIEPLPAPAAPRTYIAPTTVYRLDVAGGESRELLSNVDAYGRFRKVVSLHLAADKETMLYARQQQWFIETPAGVTRKLNVDGMAALVDPHVEWTHLYQQVWRDERDFFYDPGLQGLDLAAAQRRYLPYLAGIATRDELTYLFAEMLGNLTAGHIGVSSPGQPRSNPNAAGLLGADYAVANGRYRFTRIYLGDLWNPTLRAPLARAGTIVLTGQYLLKVDGRDVRPTQDVYGYFQGTAGKEIRLTVGPDPEGAGARDLTVVPVEDETPLRYSAWVEGNRQKVGEMTAGRIAYLHCPDASVSGYQSFNRYFFAQVDKLGVIVDDRYNSGGSDTAYIFEGLLPGPSYYGSPRYGAQVRTPQEAITGPKVMIINEMTGSAGEGLAWRFRQAGLGPLLGSRTWGGLISLYPYADDLLDGGGVGVPNMAAYDLSGHWMIENQGVAPDIEEEQDPEAVRAGHDPQLERAVAVVMDLLKRDSQPIPVHDPYPNYHQSVGP